MALRETTVARLGLVALAVALWRSAGPIVFDGLLPRYPAAVVLLVVVYVLSFGVLLAAASATERVSKVAAASIAAFAAAMIVFAFRDVIRKNASDFYPSTDGHVFMETAARYVLAGKNPYAERLGDAFRIYRMPMSHVTPFIDGDFSDRQAYPALSFLVLVPALALHVPTYLVYALAFVAAVALVVQRAPAWARPFIVAIFVLDESYSAFAYGGVTDTVWVFFLVGAIVWWRTRPIAAAILVGLACAYKQHPWFLVPLLVLRLAYEHGERPWGPAVRRFLAVVAGVFVAVNIVFVLIGPHRWFNGVTEPLVAPMAQLSEGLTAFSMTGWIAMPRKGTSLVFWGAYALAVFAYARHLRVLRDWCWVLPGIVLWFSYRALMSYWYFFALTAIAALFATERDTSNDDRDDGDDRPWRPTLIAAGVFLAGVAGFLAWCATRPAPFLLSQAGPIDAWERAGFGLRVRVENKLDRVMVPQFWVQSSSLQPLPWTTDFGPGALEPGESGVFVIRGVRGFAQFDVTEGARLEVRDRLDPGKRAFLSIPGDRTIKDVDSIPNPDFRIIEARTRVPSGWSFESKTGRLLVGPDIDKAPRIRFEFDSAGQPVSSPLAACVVAQHLGGVETTERRAVLSTVVPLPEGKIGFQIYVPNDANRPPFEKLYGITLDVRGFRLVVLLGDEMPRGTLPNGDTFVGIAAPRGAWATVEIAPRDLLQKLGVPLPMWRFQYLRSPLLDFPSTPLEIGLFAVVGSGEAKADFGSVRQEIGRDFERLAKQSSEAGLAAWRAELDIENGNYVKAADRLFIANTLEPNRDRALRLGDAYLLSLDFARARDTFAGLLAQGPFTEAESGLGFALLGLGDLDRAKEHLERARDQFRKDEQMPPRIRYVNTLRGLARLEAKKKKCEAARRIRDEILLETPGAPPPDIDPCN